MRIICRYSQRGSAVIVVLILIVSMVLFMAGNAVVLKTLRRQVKLIEQQQVHRLTSGVATNRPPTRAP